MIPVTTYNESEKEEKPIMIRLLFKLYLESENGPFMIPRFHK
jgi:hypothetical protein